MPKYDLETRKAAIQRYKLTDYKVAVCKEFNISRVTLDAWIKLEEETGGLSPKVANSRGAPSHIKDWIAFKYLLKIQNFRKSREIYKLPISASMLPIKITNPPNLLQSCFRNTL